MSSFFFFFFLQYHRDTTSFHYHWSFLSIANDHGLHSFYYSIEKKRHIDEIAIWRFILRILVLIILPIEWSLLEQTKDPLDVFKWNAYSCNWNYKCNRMYFRPHRNAIRSFQDNNFYFIKTPTSMKTFILPHHRYLISLFKSISWNFHDYCCIYAFIARHHIHHRFSFHPDHRYLTFNPFLLVTNLFSFVEIN